MISNQFLEYLNIIKDCLKVCSRRSREDRMRCCWKKSNCLFLMNMQEDISREDVAAHVGLHPDYLNRIIKKELGVSLREYIAGEKINVACELLAQTELLVGEIGEMVGYVNFSSFSTFFKNKTGMTPVAWRKEHEKC